MSVEGSFGEDNDGEFVSVATFECRGCEITAWHPTADDTWDATLSSGGVEELELQVTLLHTRNRARLHCSTVDAMNSGVP